MANMNAVRTPPVAGALLVSNDAVTIRQISESLQQLAMSPEISVEIGAALAMLRQRKFEAVIVDLHLEGQATTVLEQIRRSPSNRTTVIFTVSESDVETVSAFKAGSNFVLRKPLSLISIGRSLKVAYGLILREHRRYFRCPVQIPAVICRDGTARVHGQTVNISEGGIAITTSALLRPAVKVQVHFTLPGLASRFEVAATISWCKETYVGFQFTSLPLRLTAELQGWLLQRLEERLPEFVAEKFRATVPSLK
jgi:CheY-like chemotaxis protein